MPTRLNLSAARDSKTPQRLRTYDDQDEGTVFIDVVLSTYTLNEQGYSARGEKKDRFEFVDIPSKLVFHQDDINEHLDLLIVQPCVHLDDNTKTLPVDLEWLKRLAVVCESQQLSAEEAWDYFDKALP